MTFSRRQRPSDVVGDMKEKQGKSPIGTRRARKGGEMTESIATYLRIGRRLLDFTLFSDFHRVRGVIWRYSVRLRWRYKPEINVTRTRP